MRLDVSILYNTTIFVTCSQVGATADVARTGGECQLQRARVDTDAESGVAPSIRTEYAVHAMQ